MLVSKFDFDLPAELIAQTPACPRDSARLLHVDDTLSDLAVTDLPGLLAPGDIMVYNDTRVIRARLQGRRGGPEGGRIEVTLHNDGADVANGVWRAFVRPAKKLKLGDVLHFAPGFEARVTEHGDGGEAGLDFANNEKTVMAALAEHGVMPLPPYIKRPREGVAADQNDYQTVFAEHDGAVAAPTAGLHFTNRLLAALTARGVLLARLTLHVGPGTFLPVRVDDTLDHAMHAEWGEITDQAAETINRARIAGGRVVAIGSTTLRLLETTADGDGFVEPFRGETDIFITPGHRFKSVDRMLTNFHLPKSTLFMLVAAFAGLERIKAAYQHAKRKGYRFYSYGDACLLEAAESG
ncbi:MAG: S-adenosylmethionine:tRNA ribosyltransferase-isomerase [Alphaproteobacteria bacterium MarineAlpha3_Bin4]|nr:tRNA preQ1(34) S-adenosylmethionine ribosyltransferase-isomerase QueA [Pseudomonadota bacterium]PPR74650.1 MAG: S-adenosylmethionine:tRNA ribosyltransferase-isomerase [Alphaproteobacteria bacterium MarineAlpha3_Bin4]